MKKLNRRLSAFLTSALLSQIGSLSHADMEYVSVQGSDGSVRKFSRLIMGTDHLIQGDWVQTGQKAATEAQVFEVLDEAARNGINVIDTSPIYVGDIERIVGKWVQSRKDLLQQDSFYVDKKLNPDRKIYVISKGGFPFDLFYSKKLESGSHSKALHQELRKQDILRGNSAEAPHQLQNVPPGTYASRLYGSIPQIKKRVAAELEDTLKNLNGEIAVYLMHRDDFDSVNFQVLDRAQTPVGDIMDALSAPELAGKFPLLGWSNWTTERVNESVRKSQDNPSLKRPMFNSPYFSLFEMGDQSIHARGIQVTHEDMMNPNFQSGVLINPYSPLGGFSILDKPAPAWENAKQDAKRKYDSGDPYWKNVYHSVFTTQNEVRYRRAVRFTKKLNRTHGSDFTLDQVLNAYALAHPRTDFLTVGPINVAQVQRTVASVELSKILTPSDLNSLWEVKTQRLSCSEIASTP